MAEELKSYPAPWSGQLILACRKCQKKLKGDAALAGLAKLKKTIKRRNRRHRASQLHLINVSCMDVCPKDGVTVYRPDCDCLSILRSEKDLEAISTVQDPAQSSSAS